MEREQMKYDEAMSKKQALITEQAAKRHELQELQQNEMNEFVRMREQVETQIKDLQRRNKTEELRIEREVAMLEGKIKQADVNIKATLRDLTKAQESAAANDNQASTSKTA